MISKYKDRKLAIKLRMQGQSYGEILSKISIAKSTLSLWLRDVGLSKPQKQKITEKRLLAAQRGGDVRKKQRIALTKSIFERAYFDVDKISKRDLWLMAVMLYWAEGSKEKEGHSGSGVNFTNSDPKMLRLFLKWLLEIEHVSKKELIFEIYIHENSINSLGFVKQYWSKTLSVQENVFRAYFKKNKIKTNRKNIG
ncbi:MAG: hypothetical protein AAB756_00480, partial [Patescibacteria group bacterium]